MPLDISEKQAIASWNEFVENIRKQTAISANETESQQRERIAHLEANPEEWFKYYFPQYCYAAPAPFHIAATKRVLSHPEWYEVRAWSRELAKSTRSMMEVLYLILTKQKRYVLLISNSGDNAERLLAPYKGNLEGNLRIINDYGIQELPGSWTNGEFITRKGAAFRSLGAGQSPRGTRNEEARPDVLLFDDIDTDEECRNPDIINKKWRWIEDAAMATRSISVNTLILFLGNLIAEDCCVQRARQYAKHVDIINIRDEFGDPTWAKNTNDHIDTVLSNISYASQQKEYFNNPLSDGLVFKDITWGKVPPLEQFPFLVSYSDPSPSNKDQVKSKGQNSFKSVVLLGKLGLKYYVINAFLAQVTNDTFVDWIYAMDNYVQKKTTLFNYIENNTLQDPFYQQVFLPLFFKKAQATRVMVGILPDERKKPDKYTRIEGTLQPYNNMGLLIFNEAERSNPHMQRLEAQFKSVSPQCKFMDGPDATEGGVFIINSKESERATASIAGSPKYKNPKRF